MLIGGKNSIIKNMKDVKSLNMNTINSKYIEKLIFLII